MPRYSRVEVEVESDESAIDLEFDSDSDSDEESYSVLGTPENLFNQRLETRFRHRYPGAFRKVKRTIKYMAYLQFLLGAGLLALWKVADWKYFWHPYFRNKQLGMPMLSTVFFAGAALTAASIVGIYVWCNWNSWVSCALPYLPLW